MYTLLCLWARGVCVWFICLLRLRLPAYCSLRLFLPPFVRKHTVRYCKHNPFQGLCPQSRSHCAVLPHWCSRLITDVVFKLVHCSMLFVLFGIANGAQVSHIGAPNPKDKKNSQYMPSACIRYFSCLWGRTKRETTAPCRADYYVWTKILKRASANPTNNVGASRPGSTKQQSFLINIWLLLFGAPMDLLTDLYFKLWYFRILVV